MKEIALTQNKITFVDDSDYDWLMEYKWHAQKSRENRFVASSYINGKSILMHRLITNCPRNMQIDHANRDPLDNRRSNLRICTQSQNMRNAPKKPNKTGYRGVSYLTGKDRKKHFQAQIFLDNKLLRIGAYLTAEEAARAYDAKAKEVGGDFAILNFQEEK